MYKSNVIFFENEEIWKICVLVGNKNFLVLLPGKH